MNKDVLAGLLLLALAGGYFLATRQIPDSSLSDAVGATGLPYVLSGALAVLAVALVVKGAMTMRAPDPPPQGEVAARSADGGALLRDARDAASAPPVRPSAVHPPLRGGIEAEREADGAEESEERSTALRAAGFVLIGIGYMILAPWTGYALGLALLIVAIALYERERLSWRLFAVAAGGGVGFWLIFVRLLGTEQPVSRLLG